MYGLEIIYPFDGVNKIIIFEIVIYIYVHFI